MQLQILRMHLGLEIELDLESDIQLPKGKKSSGLQELPSALFKLDRETLPKALRHVIHYI